MRENVEVNLTHVEQKRGRFVKMTELKSNNTMQIYRYKLGM